MTTAREAISPRTVELVVAPDVDLSESSSPLAWQVLKPVDANYTRRPGRPGVDITTEVLEEMALSYDPSVDQAPINIDHNRGGGAFGWIRNVWTEDGFLYVEPEHLSPELSEGIRERRFQRVSAELDREHPETGGWYFSGLAVLGANKPIIKGLKPIHLSEGEADEPPFRTLHLSEAPRFRTLNPEDDMAPPKHETKPNDPPSPPPAAPPTLDLSSAISLAEGETITLGDLLADRARVTEQAQQVSSALDRLHLSEATTHIRSSLDELGDRLNLKARRELEPVLLALACGGDGGRHQTIELSEAGDDGKTSTVTVDAVDAVLGALRHLPTFELAGDLGSMHLADEDDPNAPKARDRRTPEQRAIDLAEGITDELALEIQQTFPTSFTT